MLIGIRLGAVPVSGPPVIVSYSLQLGQVLYMVLGGSHFFYLKKNNVMKPLPHYIRRQSTQIKILRYLNARQLI